MKTFRVTISGKSYDVQVEETTGGVQPAAPAYAPIAAPAYAAPVAAPVAPAPAPVPTPTAAPVVAPPPAPAAGANTINSPMPGTILDVKVAVGDVVEKNQVLVVLEAMKMENDIVAPEAGTVTALHVGKGTAVDANAPLVSLN